MPFEKDNTPLSQANNLSPWQKEILQRWQKTKAKSLPSSVKDELKEKFDGEIFFDEPMSRHTYIKIGGPADVFLKPRSLEAVQIVMSLASANNLPVTFVGWGANTLVRDGGVRGIVISPFDALKEYKLVQETDDFIDIEAEAGLNFSRLIHFAKEHGASLAQFTGIPGSVGGLVAMNAGTREREIQDVVRSVTFILKDGSLSEVSREKLDFEYRHLKIPRTQYIAKVLFRVEKTASPEEIDADIRRALKRRQDTQPIELPNLGCMFKNPPVTKKGEPATSAGQLVEEAGLKNVRVGGARISQKHGNFIVNEGAATAKDVVTLMGLIKDKVKTQTGIVLEAEVKIIGEEPSHE